MSVGTLQQTDRQKSILTPSVPSSPPRLSDLSSSLVTVIEWDESNLQPIIQNTAVHYMLQYTIFSFTGVQNVTVSFFSQSFIQLMMHITVRFNFSNA